MEKKTTAVEFLENELNRLGILDKGKVMTNLFTQAKQIEREQIEEAWVSGKETKGYGNTIYEDASDYFTQNYGK